MIFDLTKNLKPINNLFASSMNLMNNKKLGVRFIKGVRFPKEKKPKSEYLYENGEKVIKILQARSRMVIDGRKKQGDEYRLGGDNLYEWLLANIYEFFVIFELILLKEYPIQCDSKTCPSMTAGKEYEFRWLDKTKPEYKTATTVSAIDYMKFSFEKFKEFYDNLPLDYSKGFVKNFENEIKKFAKWSIRIFSHLNQHHHDENDNEYELDSHIKHVVYVGKIFFFFFLKFFFKSFVNNLNYWMTGNMNH